MHSPKGLARARESSIVDTQIGLMLAEPAHWYSGLGNSAIEQKGLGSNLV